MITTSMLFHSYLIGLAILIVAIVLNAIAIQMGMDTWYSFLEKIQGSGFTTALRQSSFASLFFLFLLYPFCLGMVAFLIKNALK